MCRTPLSFVPKCSSSANQPISSQQQLHHCYTQQNHTILCPLQPIVPELEHNGDAPVVNVILHFLLSLRTCP